MNVLFLDIDGVLNSARWMLKQPKTTNFIRELDRKAVALLAEIIARTNAKIVVSSSWRVMYAMSVLRDIFIESGFPAPCPIIGATPTWCHTPDGVERVRGHEIQSWLNSSAEDATVERVEEFAILDDDSDMAHLLPKLVQTDFENGLERDHVERLVAMLSPASPT